ncbi:MAG TPA: beta-ketoacyl-[acyl-carrier-protein] synthase family protein [Gemmatimonadaceae bacterium]
MVVTGLGVLAPNGHGLAEFEHALRAGCSGIRFFPHLAELKFGCQVGGAPQGVDAIAERYFSEEQRVSMKSNVIAFGAIAAVDCWKDAGFEVPYDWTGEPDFDTGAIIGTGVAGIDLMCRVAGPAIDNGRARRMGSTIVEQVMCSGVSARIGGLLGLGGQVSTNSSACCTGTEAIVQAYWRIREGRAKRVLAGGVEADSHYAWGSFDAMRVLAANRNHEPERASRPMSASASGFVPGSGAGILLLESLGSALERGARIYGEVLGGQVNSGGQRQSGSMTAPNPYGVRRCIGDAMAAAGIRGDEIDAINGHLTATMADPREIASWQAALGVPPERFPMVNSTKSLIGHTLGAAGGIECVAALLQLDRGFVHGSINCEDLHPELEPYRCSIPTTTIERQSRIIAKASFGFGDVNACVIFGAWDPEPNHFK